MRQTLLHLFVISAVLLPTLLLAGRPHAASIQQKRSTITKSEIEPSQNSVSNTYRLKSQTGFQELASIIEEAQSLQNKSEAIKVLAKSANLLWLFDTAKSRSMFEELWRLSSVETAQGSREEQRSEILRYLSSRDPGMAARLLDQAAKDSGDSLNAPFSQQVKGIDPNSQRLNSLATKLIQQQDNVRAASMLGRALSVGVNPASLATLTRLRQRDSALADRLVSRTLERLKARPTIISLTSSSLLVDYIFPASNIDADAAMVNSPSAELRNQYFFTAYEIFKKSLAETNSVLIKEQSYSASDLRFRSIYQNQLAVILGALAPKFAPELTPELTAFAKQSPSGLPATALALTRFTQLRLSDVNQSSGDRFTDIAVALAKGDIHQAERLLGGVDDETFRKAVSQTVAKVAFGVYLAKSELDQAMVQARKFDDMTTKAIAYAQVARTARAKGDTEFAKLIVADSLSLLNEGTSTQLKARALLLLAPEALPLSISDSLDLLNRAVSVINDLPENSGSSDAYGDDPLSLKDSPELQRAFSVIGVADFQRTISIAKQIQPQLIGLLARLATLETVIKKSNIKSRPSMSRKNAVTNPFKLTTGFLQHHLSKAISESVGGNRVSDTDPGQCWCGGCMVNASFTTPLPGPWWDCTSECMRSPA